MLVPALATFAVALALAAPCAPARTQEPGAAAASQPPDEAALAARRSEVRALLERLLPAVEAELADADRDPIDVPALARRLGGVEAAIAFVRDEIAFEPYDGVLRGAEGALLARRANSFDRALLLQRLLAALGHRARLAVATLEDGEAERLLAAFLRGPADAAPAGRPATEDGVAAAARATGLPAAALAAHVAERGAAAERLLADAERLAAVHAAAMREALGERRGDAAAMRAALRDAVRRHAVLQLQVPSAKAGGEPEWRLIDASPLGLDAAAVEPLGAAPEHRLRFELRYAAEGAAPATILDVTTAVADAVARPLRLSIVGVDPVPPPSEWLASAPQQVRQRILSTKRFQALLRRGGADDASRVFDLEGGLHDVQPDGRVKAAAELGGALQRGFGGLGGGGGAGAAAKKGFVALTATWTLQAPNGENRSFTRVLLDAAGVARGERPERDVEILLLGGPANSPFAARLELRARLPVWRAARDVLAADDEAAVLATVDRLVAHEPDAAPTSLLAVQLLRQTHAARLAGDGTRLRAWQPTPQLLLFEQRARVCDDAAGDCSVLRFDWMANDVRFVPVVAEDDGAARAAFDAALRQGAFDTVLEALLLERALPLAPLTSAAHALERARAAGAPWADPPRAPAAGGERVVLAVAGEGGARYEVDPRFGCAVGRLPDGSGGAVAAQALVEFLKSQRPVFWSMMCATPNVIGAAMGKRKGSGLALSLIGCMFGFGARFSGYVAGVQGAKLTAEALGFLGDFLSATFAISGFFI